MSTSNKWNTETRKFCDFCKCWIANNKPSREFHEQGKRHQENVAKKLSDLQKKGVADAKQAKQTASSLQFIERAALRKLKEDLSKDPTLAGMYGVELNVPEKQVSTTVQAAASTAVDTSSDVGEWCEAYTPEGYKYYWNTVTSESRWELPAISGKTASDDTSSQKCTDDNDTKKDDDCQGPATKIEGSLSRKERKALQKLDAAEKAVRDLEAAVTLTATCEPDPRRTDHSAYGQWQTVVQDQLPVQDLQLPVDSRAEKKAEQKTFVVTQEPKIKFAEKKAKTISSGDSVVAFKKRRINAGGLRKMDDEDKT